MRSVFKSSENIRSFCYLLFLFIMNCSFYCSDCDHKFVNDEECAQHLKHTHNSAKTPYEAEATCIRLVCNDCSRDYGETKTFKGINICFLIVMLICLFIRTVCLNKHKHQSHARTHARTYPRTHARSDNKLPLWYYTLYKCYLVFNRSRRNRSESANIAITTLSKRVSFNGIFNWGKNEVHALAAL